MYKKLSIKKLDEKIKTNKFNSLAIVCFEIKLLKSKCGLSNKAWDKGIKFLTKSNLASVTKNEEGLFVELKN